MERPAHPAYLPTPMPWNWLRSARRHATATRKPNSARLVLEQLEQLILLDATGFSVNGNAVANLRGFALNDPLTWDTGLMQPVGPAQRLGYAADAGGGGLLGDAPLTDGLLSISAGG